MTTAAIYARYSSDRQNEKSIDDQLRVCRRRVEAEGWTLVQAYADAAISGASDDRPEYRQMLGDAGAGRFAVVVAEDLDRLSRDQEHTARLYKHLTFNGVRLVTLADGEINELHVGLKGTMSALFLKQLAQKTRRGLEGRVREGRSGGGLAYGYDVVRGLDARGEPVRGRRRINPEQAAVVRCIFADFADGRGPREIAQRLNAEGLRSPRGNLWAGSAIYAMVRNDLYAGRLVWNRARWLKNPETGRRVSRPNPESEWVIQPVPELRIIDEELWERTQARISGLAEATAAKRAETGSVKSRAGGGPRYLFSGILRCGVCGGPFSMTDYRYGCSRHYNRGPKACANGGKATRKVVEERLLAAIKADLFTPEAIALLKREVRRLLRERRAGCNAEADRVRRELAQVERELANLIQAMREAEATPTALVAEVARLEGEKMRLERALGTDPTRALDNIDDLLPRIVERYQGLVADFETVAARDVSRARQVIRSLVGGTIQVRPTDAGGLDAELQGDYAGLITLAGNGKSPGARGTGAVKAYLVAGAGFEPATFRL